MDSRPQVAPVATSAPPGTAHVARALARRGLAGLYRAGRRHGLFRGAPRELTVLAFHRIGNPAALGVGLGGLVNADVAGFDRTLSFLGEHFTFVSAELVKVALADGERLPPDSLLLTFDDGYRDFVSHALPVLTARHIPVLIFPTLAGLVVPRRLLWFDRIALAVDRGIAIDADTLPGAWPSPGGSPEEREAHKLELVTRLLDAPPATRRRIDEALGRRISSEAAVAGHLYLGADDLRTLPPGVSVGSHGVTHRTLAGLDAEDLSAELTRSKEALEAATGRTVESFAYPVGRPQDVPADAEAALAAAQYAMAFTMIAGRNVLGSPGARYRLRRISAGHSLVELQSNLLRGARRAR